MPLRNETPAPRALARKQSDEEIAAAQSVEEDPSMTHADLREMLRRNVAALRALLEDSGGEG